MADIIPTTSTHAERLAAEKRDASDDERQAEQPEAGEAKVLTMEERKAKMDELRRRMVRLRAIGHGHSLTCEQQKSAQANRASLVNESSQLKQSARETARLERQRKLAETLREKADAEVSATRSVDSAPSEAHSGPR